MGWREMAGVALVFGALYIAAENSHHRDQRVIEVLACVCIGWMSLAALKPWTMRTALVIAGASLFLSVSLLIIGYGSIALIPLAVTIHHGAIVGWEIYQSPEEPRVVLRESMRKKAPPPPRREAPPKLDDDPFRSPPQAPPIVVRRAQTAPTSVPVDHDERAAKPKLLT